jgi:hypothetical protein
MADDWKSGLPEELKNAPALKDVQDVSALAKAFVETKAFVGSSIRPPGPDATPEAKTDFIQKLRDKVPELLFMPDGDDEPAKLARETAWAKLGRPKEAKDYTLPVEVSVPEDHLEALRKEALDEGLTKSQFQSRARRVAEAIATAETGRQDSTRALKRELGAAFDERTASVAAVAARLGFSQELVAALKSGTVDVATFKAFTAIAKGFGETRQVAGQEGGGTGRKTPAEAAAERAEIMARPEYFRPTGMQMGVHETLKRKVQELNELIEAGG